MAGYLGRPARPDGLLDLLGQHRDRVLVDRPALAGFADPDDDLRAAERLGHPAPLDHREDGLLDRGEPLATFRAGPPSPDELPVVGFPGVDHPRVGVAAVRAP